MKKGALFLLFLFLFAGLALGNDAKGPDSIYSEIWKMTEFIVIPYAPWDEADYTTTPMNVGNGADVIEAAEGTIQDAAVAGDVPVPISVVSENEKTPLPEPLPEPLLPLPQSLPLPAPLPKPLPDSSCTWGQVLPATERFKPVMGDEVILDRETGLMWEKSTNSRDKNWADALIYCFNLNLGGRMGWRLPSAEELTSLIDMSVSTAPRLPEGHPFVNVQSSYYWSSTTYANNPGLALAVSFYGGYVDYGSKDDKLYVRCVRLRQ